MEKHPDMARGFFKGDKLNLEQLWVDLTDELNASGPPIKETSSWKKVWSDLRLGVKQKLAHNKIEVHKTGGGLFNKYVLSPVDEQIALICGLYASVDGVKNAKTFGLPSKEFYNSKEESTTAMASAPTLPSTSTSTSTFSIENLENVGVASPENQPVQRHQNEAFASTSSSPKPTQVSNRKRKRHTADVDDVLNMEAEHFSKICAICARKKKKVNRKYLKEVSLNIRDVRKELKEIKLLKQEELKEIKRHNFVIEKNLQTRN